MKLSKENIESVIPHRQPFIMVDNLLEATSNGFESDFEVRTDNVFLSDNILQEPALIENIAQTCAAGFGFLDSKSGGAPRLGFIGAVNKVVVHDLPALNSVIKTKVEVLHQLENIFLVKGENFLGDKILLECEMKIVIN